MSFTENALKFFKLSNVKTSLIHMSFRCVHIYLIYIFKTLEFILQNKLIIGLQHLFIKH